MCAAKLGDEVGVATVVSGGFLKFIVEDGEFFHVIIRSHLAKKIRPGQSVAVTMGNVAPDFRPEGFGFKQPFVTRIEQISIRQRTRAMPASAAEMEKDSVL